VRIFHFGPLFFNILATIFENLVPVFKNLVRILKNLDYVFFPDFRKSGPERFLDNPDTHEPDFLKTGTRFSKIQQYTRFLKIGKKKSRFLKIWKQHEEPDFQKIRIES